MRLTGENQLGLILGGMILVTVLWSVVFARGSTVNAEDIRSISGCYVNGEAVVRIRPDRVGVLAGARYLESKPPRFTRDRNIVVMSDLSLTFDPDARRLVARTDRGPASLVINGSGDAAYIHIFDGAGRSRVTFGRKACPPLS